jgi:hypothetical protein
MEEIINVQITKVEVKFDPDNREACFHLSLKWYDNNSIKKGRMLYFQDIKKLTELFKITDSSNLSEITNKIVRAKFEGETITELKHPIEPFDDLNCQETE